MVERDLAKVDVAGSTPVSRSIIPPAYRLHREISARFASLCFLMTLIAVFACGARHRTVGC